MALRDFLSRRLIVLRACDDDLFIVFYPFYLCAKLFGNEAYRRIGAVILQKGR